MPKYETASSVGADLKGDKEVTVEPKSSALIGTGVFIESWQPTKDGKLPMLDVRPRSSSLTKNQLLVQFGTIDPDYDGEIKVVVYNPTDKPITVLPEVRLAQLVLHHVDRVDNLAIAVVPRSGGFGSTGGLL